MHLFRHSPELQSKQARKAVLRQRLLQLFRNGVIAAFLFNSVLLYHLIFSPSHSSNTTYIITHIASILGQLVGTFFCIRALPRFWRADTTLHGTAAQVRTAQRWMPLWVGLAFLSGAIGDGVYTINSALHIVPPVDWPNAVYLAHYPLLLLAILSLPSRPLSRTTHLRVVLDGLLIVTALITFSWYFLLGPMLLQSHTTMFDKLVGAAFPCWDIILCNFLFQTAFRSSAPALLLTRRMFYIGLIGIIIAHGLDEYQIVQGNSSLELWRFLSECLGYIFIGISVQFVNTIHEDKISLEHTPSAPLSTAQSPFWSTLLPYAFIPMVGGLILFVWFVGRPNPLTNGVYLGGVLLMIQVVVRQILVLRESHFANKKMRAMQDELAANNQALNEANTHLRQANQRLEAQAKALEVAYEQQRQVNELKDQFLLNVNHELRTPLTEVYGYLELLSLKGQELDQTLQATFLSHALHGSEELLRLVSTILDALQSSQANKALNWEELPLACVVQEVIDLFGPQKRAAYQFRLNIPDHLTVRADRASLHQIFWNLFSNIFKYCPPQTTIEIGAHEEMHAHNSQKAASDPSTACIWVKDEGPGISPDEIPLLFEKFVRLKRDQTSTIRGTGLGLYISKQLVEAMGGRIWVESSGVPGEGCRFCFTLPLSEQRLDDVVSTQSSRSFNM